VLNSNLFHDKEGVFYLDWENKKIGFNGSENETYSGMERNGGSFSLFKSWVPGQKEYVDDIEEAFDLAWENELDGLEVRNLNKKILEAIKSKAPENIKEFFKKNNFITKKNWRDYIKDLNQEDNRPFENAIAEDVRKKLKEKFLDQSNKNKEDYLEVTEKKWEFQKKAREKFINKKWGLLEMATGTGKTRTALSIATQLINEKKINKIILQMFGSDLIDQWHKNVNKWTESKIDREVNILNDEKKDFDFFLMNYQNDDVDFIIIRQSRLPDLLEDIKDFDQSKTLIIHDEVP
jgi:DNA or RNA helicases of superfamily II